MNKLLLPTLAAGSLMLSGCAAGLGGGLGGYGGGDPLAGILGSVLSGGLGGGLGTQGYRTNTSGSQFQSAAVNACGQQASQYGQVSVTNVEQVSNDTLRVDGRVSASAYQQRTWACAFRADGRITDFRMG